MITKKISAWQAHVLKFAKDNNIPYNKALTLARSSYVKGQAPVIVPDVKLNLIIKKKKPVKVKPPPTARYVYVKYFSVKTIQVSDSYKIEYFKRIYGNDVLMYNMFGSAHISYSDEMIDFYTHNLYKDEERLDDGSLNGKWRVIYVGPMDGITDLEPWDVPEVLTSRPFLNLSGSNRLDIEPQFLDAIKVSSDYTKKDIEEWCKIYLGQIYDQSKYKESVMFWSYEVFNSPKSTMQIGNLPVYKRILNYDKFGKKAFETAYMKRNGKCGIEAIYDRFYEKQKQYRLVKWFENNGLMITRFIRQEYEAQQNAIIITSDFELQINDLPEWDGKTTTANILLKLCQAMNVSCYIASEDSDIICSYKSTRVNQHDICFAGYVADGHFYRVDDIGKIKSIVRKSQKKDTSKPINLDVEKQMKSFCWKTAKLLIVDSNIRNRQILEFLDTKHENPTCMVIDTPSLERFNEYMLKKHDRVLNDNAFSNMVKGDENTRIVAVKDIDDIQKFLQIRGMYFEPKWTITTISKAIFDECVPNIPSDELLLEFENGEEMRYAYKLANEYINSDLAEEMDISSNITAQDIFAMVKSIKRCQASYRKVYLAEVSDEIRAAMDKINNKLPYTRDNCRLVSVHDKLRRKDTPFHIYRQENNYLPDMSSRYSDEVLKQFVGTPAHQIKDKSVTKKFNNPIISENLACMDISKSYATCMYQGFLNNYINDEYSLEEFIQDGKQVFFDFPVYSMFDTVEAYTGGDLKPGRYYIEFHTESRDGIQYFEDDDQKDLMYFPNTWYNTSEVWYLMNKTDFKFTITHQFVASNSMPYYSFRTFIKNVRKNYSIDTAKLMINTLSGALGKSTSSNVKKYVTTNKAWASYFLFKHKDEKASRLNTGETKSGLKYYSIVSENKQILQSNTVPIYNSIIGIARIRQFHLYQLMKKIAPCRLIQCFTDSPVVEYTCRGDVEKCYLEMKKYKMYRRTAYKIIDQLQTAVSRAVFKPSEQKWKTSPQDELTRHIIDELTKSDFNNKDAFIEQTNSWGGMLNGCIFEGLPGTAKSHMLKMIYEYHRANGKRVLAVSFTNAAADRLRKDGIPAKTIHKALGINQDTGKTKSIPNIDVLIIDELLMAPSNILATILELKRAGKFIVYGATDQYQLESIDDKISIDELYNSNVYGDLANWTKYVLGVCVRSDETMFKMYKSIAEKQSVEHIQPWLDSKKSTELCYTNLCYTNDRRIELNQQCAAIYCQSMGLIGAGVKFREIASNGISKDVIYPLVPAMPLIVTHSYKNILTKGSRYVLEGWNELGFTIVSNGEEPILLGLEAFTNNLTLAFATTVHKSQGMTIQNKYKLYETRKYSWRMLYVAISRTTDESNILVD
jgi:AAA domain